MLLLQYNPPPERANIGIPTAAVIGLNANAAPINPAPPPINPPPRTFKLLLNPQVV